MSGLISELVKIGRENKAGKIILFGSRARGDNTDKSDYDVAFVSPGLSPELKNKITDRIDEIDTFHKIDIVFLNDLNSDDDLTKNIVRDGVILMDKFQTKFENYKNALSRLEEAVGDFERFDILSVRDGAIQRFEFTTELAWKTIREYLLSEQVSDINTPKAVMREAFAANLIDNEQGWIQILNDRNATSHIYDEKEANQIFDRIKNEHIKLFRALAQKLAELD